jgi:hypothetical protein
MQPEAAPQGCPPPRRAGTAATAAKVEFKIKTERQNHLSLQLDGFREELRGPQGCQTAIIIRRNRKFRKVRGRCGALPVPSAVAGVVRERGFGAPPSDVIFDSV